MDTNINPDNLPIEIKSNDNEFKNALLNILRRIMSLINDKQNSELIYVNNESDIYITNLQKNILRVIEIMLEKGFMTQELICNAREIIKVCLATLSVDALEKIREAGFLYLNSCVETLSFRILSYFIIIDYMRQSIDQSTEPYVNMEYSRGVPDRISKIMSIFFGDVDTNLVNSTLARRDRTEISAYDTYKTLIQKVDKHIKIVEEQEEYMNQPNAQYRIKSLNIMRDVLEHKIPPPIIGGRKSKKTKKTNKKKRQNKSKRNYKRRAVK
jgi:hypothetical protein